MLNPPVVVAHTSCDEGISREIPDGYDPPSMLESILPVLYAARVVYLGEYHDNYAHHLKQLEIIQHLYRHDPALAIGMEQFYQPFQGVLDGYLSGTLDLESMLQKTQWRERWGFDHRLYLPVFEFVRHHQIPLMALNIPRELTACVAKVGIDGLTKEQRSQLPQEIDDSDPTYRERLFEVFQQHPHCDRQRFERFFQVQLLWDEGMAKQISDYLRPDPKRRMVVLAGSGHLVYRFGIPSRVERRIGEPGVVLLPEGSAPIAPGVADFILLTGREELPPESS